MTNSVSTIQTCESCLKRKQNEKHIVTRETSNCISLCEHCFILESVCSACKENGQVSHIQSLRVCNTCLKVAVMAIVTDCEEWNKQALLELDSLAETSALLPELVLAVPFPDVVHLGKSVKCSRSSWFIELDGEMSNLVLLHTLRDCNNLTIRNRFRKLLTLECVRNKDRMSVEPIVRLTLNEVHTIVPEKYRFWKNNQPGICPRPIAVSTGPHGTVLVLHYDFNKATSKLTIVRVHQPADECIKKEGLKDARDLYYNDGVAFIAERGSGAISFCDFEKRLQVDFRAKVKSLKRKPGLVSLLQRLGLDTEGTVPTLKDRLKEYLHQIADKIQRLDQVQVRPPLLKPSAICTACA